MLQPGFYNMDCMDGMREFPDGYFELAIVDPPYGGGFTEGGGCCGWFEKHKPKQNGGARHTTNGLRKGQAPPEWWSLCGGNGKKIIAWDVAPDQSYFDELFRVSQNQIIWGGQLF